MHILYLYILLYFKMQLYYKGLQNVIPSVKSNILKNGNSKFIYDINQYSYL